MRSTSEHRAMAAAARPPTSTRRADCPRGGLLPAPYAAPAPYVSPEMTGAADLSAYGNQAPSRIMWVWYPSGVPRIEPYTTYGQPRRRSAWGWTWIDDPGASHPSTMAAGAIRTPVGAGSPATISKRRSMLHAFVVFFGGPERHFFYDGYREGIGWCPVRASVRAELLPEWMRKSPVADAQHQHVTNVNISQVNSTRVNNTIVVNNQNRWERAITPTIASPRWCPQEFFPRRRGTSTKVAVRPAQYALHRTPASRPRPPVAPRTAAVNAGSAVRRSSTAATVVSSKSRRAAPALAPGAVRSNWRRRRCQQVPQTASPRAMRCPDYPFLHRAELRGNNRARPAPRAPRRATPHPDSLQGTRRGADASRTQHRRSKRPRRAVLSAAWRTDDNNRATGTAAPARQRAELASRAFDRQPAPGHGNHNVTSNTRRPKPAAAASRHGGAAVNNHAGVAAPSSKQQPHDAGVPGTARSVRDEYARRAQCSDGLGWTRLA